MVHEATVTPVKSNPFLRAFFANAIWVNVSGLPRYFFVVKPMLHGAYPDNPDLAPVSFPILASWGIWTIGFVIASTGFYWMYYDRYGNTSRTVLLAALWFTLGTLGLTWLGIVNMGMVPISILFAALSWAFVEQIVSAYIVSWVMKKD